MMNEGAVPIEHKEYDKGKRKIHYKKYPAAGAVFDKLLSHFLARLIPSGVSDQKKSHRRKADIIDSERTEPKCAVIKAKPELKCSVQSIPGKRAVKRDVYTQSGILAPLSRVFILIFKALEILDNIGDPEAPDRQSIGGKKV